MLKFKETSYKKRFVSLTVLHKDTLRFIAYASFTLSESNGIMLQGTVPVIVHLLCAWHGKHSQF